MKYPYEIDNHLIDLMSIIAVTKIEKSGSVNYGNSFEIILNGSKSIIIKDRPFERDKIIKAIKDIKYIEFKEDI